jgi:hypothetical protein
MHKDKSPFVDFKSMRSCRHDVDVALVTWEDFKTRILSTGNYCCANHTHSKHTQGCAQYAA